MELIIVKDNHIFARATDEEYSSEHEYELKIAEAPTFPTEEAGRGKEWVLDYVNNVLTWIKKDRPLTTEERLDDIEQEILIWKPNEAVKVGDKRYYNGHWYECLQAHTTQADWTPDVTPALWKLLD